MSWFSGSPLLVEASSGFLVEMNELPSDESEPLPQADAAGERLSAAASLSEKDDFALMERVASQDEAAMAELIRRHQAAVYGTIVKMLGDPVEAEDIAQLVFVRVYRAAPSYQASAQFRTWLFTIVRHLVFNEHRRRGRAKFFSLSGSGTEEESQEAIDLPDRATKSASQEVLDAELMDSVNRAILELPDQQRMAVVLRRYDEFSYEEIAGVLGVSVASVKSLLFRARETLRVKLQAYMAEGR